MRDGLDGLRHGWHVLWCRRKQRQLWPVQFWTVGLTAVLAGAASLALRSWAVFDVAVPTATLTSLVNVGYQSWRYRQFPYVEEEL